MMSSLQVISHYHTSPMSKLSWYIFKSTRITTFEMFYKNYHIRISKTHIWGNAYWYIFGILVVFGFENSHFWRANHRRVKLQLILTIDFIIFVQNKTLCKTIRLNSILKNFLSKYKIKYKHEITSTENY